MHARNINIKTTYESVNTKNNLDTNRKKNYSENLVNSTFFKIPIVNY